MLFCSPEQTSKKAALPLPGVGFLFDFVFVNQLWCSLQALMLKIPIWKKKKKKWRFVGMLYCPPLSTVYNIFLCLHIFSVHITHQNKKRNYENLDQLSYDNKRGPKVYLHGQCTPPTNFPNVATRNQPKPVTSRPRNAPLLLVARVFL